MYIHAQHIMALKHTYAHAQSSHTCSLGNFVIEGRTSGQQAGYQVATLVSTLVIAIAEQINFYLLTDRYYIMLVLECQYNFDYCICASVQV